jgi:hypothetical protein
VCDFKSNCLYKGKLLKAHFSKIVAPHNKYYIEIFSDSLLIASIEMALDKNGMWNLLPPIPNWTLDIKDELIRSISAYSSD